MEDFESLLFAQKEKRRLNPCKGINIWTGEINTRGIDGTYKKIVIVI
jgi:hypothetical protein